jgi:hypothetical protein
MTDSNDNNMTLASDGERLLTTFGGFLCGKEPAAQIQLRNSGPLFLR